VSGYPKHKKPRKKPIKITKIIRDSVLSRDFETCALCNDKAVDLHHIVFRSHGGNNSSYNLISLCRVHHLQAHSYQHKYYTILFNIQKMHYPSLNKEMMIK
jgi:5-methylcytosine-specific restriction endonuclease McrA